MKISTCVDNNLCDFILLVEHFMKISTCVDNSRNIQAIYVKWHIQNFGITQLRNLILIAVIGM